MKDRHFREMLEARWAEGKFVCVGLDSDFEKIPEHLKYRTEDERDNHIAMAIVRFNSRIIEATKDLVCAYKPNSAFYEAYGDEGLRALNSTIGNIHIMAPGVPVILDAKRADIGNTNDGYVRAAFHDLKADAITVHPYLGQRALQPFLDQRNKGIFVLCRTSNPGAGEFQDLITDGTPLYQRVARNVASNWNTRSNCGLVVGATYPDELREVRGICNYMPILIPGIGAQGGDVEKTVVAAKDVFNTGMIINSSRGIIFASNGEDFADVARRETEKLHQQIRSFI